MTPKCQALSYAIFVILIRFVFGDNNDNNDNVFIFPAAPGPSTNYVTNLVWTLGSDQNIQWTTPYTSYTINLWQQNMTQAAATDIHNIYSSQGDGSGDNSLNWTVQTYGADLSQSHVFFLELNEKSSDNMITCHYFNITNQATSSSTTASATSAPATSTSSAASQTSASTSSPTPSSSSSSSTAEKVGLGVGLGIGIPLVLIAGIWIGIKVVKQRRSSDSTDAGMPLSENFDNNKSPYPADPSNPPAYFGDVVHEAPDQSHEPHEAPADTPLIELDNHPR